ncbi:MAG: hypothetical protein JWN63_2623 [Candidatus Acidoferrum typicum]|nr:hypothetical protein [Candidatus Acidoferrum typicum]
MDTFPNRCQHIKVNGTQCGSPALRRNRFCYFHKLHHEERIQLNTDRARRRRNVAIVLPVLEDANSIQVTLMQIMRLIIAGQIDGKIAGLLLYALQTATANLPRMRLEPYMKTMVLDPKRVHETALEGNIWNNSDFYTEENETEDMRLAALKEAHRKAEKKAEIDRWAELETKAFLEQQRRQAAPRNPWLNNAGTFPKIPAPPAMPAAPVILPPAPAEALSTEASPTEAPPRKLPSSTIDKEKIDKEKIRNDITDQIMNALPAIAAAQFRREKSNGST